MAAGSEMRAGLVDETVEHGEAVRTAVESEVRFVVAHAARQFGNVAGRDVGWVTDDQVELLAWLQRAEQVALEETDAFGNALFLGILACDGKRSGALVDRRH